MITVYNRWGFVGNPFSAMPLFGDSIGSSLLVGRDKELQSVIFRLQNSAEAVCLDGPIGVGKTSLANVSAFRCFQDYIASPQSCPIIIPCRKPFQIPANFTPEEFKFQVLLEIAQTLIELAPTLSDRVKLSTGKLNSWLNQPTFKQVEGQIMGFGGGAAVSLNETKGFSESGFFRLMTGWLEELFPDRNSGGIVCVIDNLELLETSDVARRTIEALRDTLFTINGIRWILCGAHGIIQGMVESPRLTGYLGQPIKVQKLQLKEAHQVFKSRISAFNPFDNNEAYLPITADSFHRLYLILGKSLRQTLATTHQYCLNIAEYGSPPDSEESKNLRFNQWLKAQALATKKTVEAHVGQKAMDLLRAAASKYDGEFTPSDYAGLGFNSVQALRSQVKNLEDVGAVESSRDETDQRRRSVMITGKGWLVDWENVTA